jgi:hypothetical protein
LTSASSVSSQGCTSSEDLPADPHESPFHLLR